MSDRLRAGALACCALGLAIAAYLTYVHYAGISPVCEIAHGCEKVQTSQWSSLAGVPVALLGLGRGREMLGVDVSKPAQSWTREDRPPACPGETSATLRG
jgi:hypothetical protein